MDILKFKTFKIPLLPIHVVTTGELKQIRENLVNRIIDHKVFEGLLNRVAKYRQRYGEI